MYKEIVIAPCASVFGKYQASEFNGDTWEDEQDLLDAMRNTDFILYELGVDDLPGGLEDIRGHIHNEPTRVFGYVDEQDISRYVGISEF